MVSEGFTSILGYSACRKATRGVSFLSEEDGVMRYAAILFVGLLALSWTPGLVSAQGLFGCSDVGSSGGLPILGKLLGKKKKAVSCYEDPPRGPGLAFYVGYLDNAGGVDFGLNAVGVGVRTAHSVELQYPISGVLLAGSGAIPVTKRLDILVNGSWLVPSGGDKMREWTRDANGNITSDVNWDTKNQWWNAGAAATFNVTGPFSVIGGILFDSFTTNFSNPPEQNNMRLLVSDEADLRISAVIPYMGGLLTQGSPAGSLTIGMIGFPFLFGHAEFAQSMNESPWSRSAEISGPIYSGYFFEIFTETSVNIGAMSAGIFAGWNIMHALAGMEYDFTAFASGTGAPWPLNVSRDYTGSFYRSAWVLGGKFGLDFISPL